jgi:thiamine transport system ATP-binding protein
MLFQENNLFTHLTVRQNIALGMHPGLKLNDAQRQKLALPRRWGSMRWTGCRASFPAASVSAWRWPCLVREQPVLLLDEPFSALDPALRQEMLTLVQDVCQRQQLTMLMVSHSVEDAARIAPRSVVIAEGVLPGMAKPPRC